MVKYLFLNTAKVYYNKALTLYFRLVDEIGKLTNFLVLFIVVTMRLVDSTTIVFLSFFVNYSNEPLLAC